MSNTIPREADASRSVTVFMADKFGMDPRAFESTVRAICLPQKSGDPPATREEFVAFLIVAKQYDLNPILKEIYGFRGKGSIQPVVSIDGWSSLINRRPELDGIEFDDHLSPDGKTITAITCRVWRKDRSRPVTVTEYMDECKRGTDPWRQWPRRMLRHKALIQAARYAFGFSGIVDPDEAERLAVARAEPMVAPALPPEEPPPAIAAPQTAVNSPPVPGGENVHADEAVFEDDAPPPEDPPQDAPPPTSPPRGEVKGATAVAKVEIDDTTFVRNIEGELRKLAVGEDDLLAKFETISTAAEGRMDGMFPPDAGALSDLLERYRKELDL